ncbi:CRISPR-associated helicase Cas3' [Clostridiales bacterium]|nr:CRISPR-associated helicase Cas3' [Clostridiales bacterium]
MLDSVGYLAHSATNETPEGQKLVVHLKNVAHLTGIFCSSFGIKDAGEICGMFHDIGKYSQAFQARLNGSNNKVDHSTAGAFELFKANNIPAAICIAGHHGGLTDLGTRNDMEGTFMARINHAKAGELEEYNAWHQEIESPETFHYPDLTGLDYYYLIRMMFSSLTDADWLDTEAYFSGCSYAIPEANMNDLKRKLDLYVEKWWDAKEDINIRRCKILRAAMDAGSWTPGLFSMAVPTGGGKTISSMAFALNHAAVHNKRRIIYVIPYCSILEQTQGVFEEVFGRDQITAHYSGAEYQRGENDSDNDKKAFAVENWEAPIILTTAVQFFESLYAAQPGKSRKIHNIANSVIIFDEAQMLPVPLLEACISGICQLVQHFKCSAVLCTATQPAIGPLIKKYAEDAEIRELCPEPEQMYEAFRRVHYKDEGYLPDEQLIERVKGTQQVLCVVNSRRQAQSLYSLLETEEGTFHLSTMMTPYDRKEKLRLIRERLKNGETCRVISTSLIEAGVDVDFPVVWRALAGLDSIVQTGGRCNREGKRSAENSIVHVFRTEDKAPKMLEQNIAATERILRCYEQIDSPDAIHEYFQFLLYTLKDEKQLDEKGILHDAEKLMFETVARHFRMIEGAGYTIYIPISEGKALAQRLREEGPSRTILQKLGQYSVSVYHQYFEQLERKGMIDKITDTSGILTDISIYSQETGLPFTVSEQDQAIFI